MRKLTLALGLGLLLLASACTSVPPRAGELATDEQRTATYDRMQKELGLFIEMDDPMPRAALQSVSNALFVTRWHKFRPVSPGHPFIRFFGSDSVGSIYGFLRDRVHHVGVMDADLVSAEKIRHVYAANTGSALWQLKEESYVNAFRLGGKRVEEIESPRYGLIELAPTTLIEAKEVTETDVTRFRHFAVLAHEARHSDCSGGVDGAVLRARQSLPPSCTYGHVACKSGPFKGGAGFACDPLFWGAYSVEYVILDAIADSCVDCNLTTRRSLKLYAIETASRLNLLPDALASRIHQIWADPDAEIKREAETDTLIREINAVLMSKQLPEPDLTSGVIVN